MVLEIAVSEVLKCGGSYLFKFNCPKCFAECLCGLDNIFCENCEALDAIYDLSSVKRWRNIISHDDQKRRKPISIKTVRKLKEVQDNKCAYCFASLEHEYHVDHIMPLSFGGGNNDDNLALCCPRCNLLASNKVFNTMFGKSQYVLSKLYPKSFRFTTH